MVRLVNNLFLGIIHSTLCAKLLFKLGEGSLHVNGLALRSGHIHMPSKLTLNLSSQTNEASENKVNALLDVIDTAKNDQILSLIMELEKDYAKKNVPLNSEDSQNDDVNRFDKVLGYFTVDKVVSIKNKNDNPVGGRWTRKNSVTKRLFRSRRTFQHILPAMNNKTKAIQAVNILSFDALFGLIRLSVVLRGDVVPLSQEERKNCTALAQLDFDTNLAVRAQFDPPRIIIGKGKILNFNLGPKSAVVLDTTYVDDKVRIGMGGTSGTRFVFRKVGGAAVKEEPDSEEMREAIEFRSLISRKPLRRSKVYLFSFCGLVNGFFNIIFRKEKNHIISGVLSVMVSTFFALLFSLSKGGIEDDYQTN